MVGVYLKEPVEKIRATVKLLQYYRSFLRSDCHEAKDPQQWGSYMNKAQAGRRLHWLIDVAINRKAGVECKERCCDPLTWIGWRRDQQRLQDIHRRIRVYQFETEEVKTRFSHLLSKHDD
jgi:hypothetical protein